VQAVRRQRESKVKYSNMKIYYRAVLMHSPGGGEIGS